MWIIKDGKKEEYDPTEVYATKTDWGTYVVTLADEIRKSSVVIYETDNKNEALDVSQFIFMGMKTDRTVIIDHNEDGLNLRLDVKIRPW